jgi:hypothetical protein
MGFRLKLHIRRKAKHIGMGQPYFSAQRLGEMNARSVTGDGQPITKLSHHEMAEKHLLKRVFQEIQPQKKQWTALML